MGPTIIFTIILGLALLVTIIATIVLCRKNSIKESSEVLVERPDACSVADDIDTTSKKFESDGGLSMRSFDPEGETEVLTRDMLCEGATEVLAQPSYTQTEITDSLNTQNNESTHSNFDEEVAKLAPVDVSNFGQNSTLVNQVSSTDAISIVQESSFDNSNSFCSEQDVKAYQYMNLFGYINELTQRAMYYSNTQDDFVTVNYLVDMPRLNLIKGEFELLQDRILCNGAYCTYTDDSLRVTAGTRITIMFNVNFEIPAPYSLHVIANEKNLKERSLKVLKVVEDVDPKSSLKALLLAEKDTIIYREDKFFRVRIC